LAFFHAKVGEAYLNLHQIDLAEEQIRQASELEEWQGNVILAMAHLAYAKGQYDESIRYHQRGLQRYGFDWEHVLGLADCYEKTRQADQAIRLLEGFVLKGQPSTCVHLIPRLMELYATRKNPQHAREILDFLLQSGRRNRGLVLDTLRAYKKINAKEADELIKRIDQIMAGPES